MIRRSAVTLLIAVALLMCTGIGWLIVEGTRGEPGLQSWESPIQVDIYRGNQYIFISWYYKKER
jgi:hypothetical protein